MVGDAEVIHGRWAMLGVAGATAPETMKGFIPDSTAVVWFKNGIIPAQGSYDFAATTALFWVMVCMMNFVEINRLTEYANPGFRTKQSLAGLEKGMGGTGNPAYPGGSFNPMGMGKNDMDAMKVKEIKNGRLAMMAFFGIMVQAIITGEGPVKNLTDHVTDPFAHNLLTNFLRTSAACLRSNLRRTVIVIRKKEKEGERKEFCKNERDKEREREREKSVRNWRNWMCRNARVCA